MYGTQAARGPGVRNEWFENDVNMYGTQANSARTLNEIGLRMM